MRTKAVCVFLLLAAAVARAEDQIIEVVVDTTIVKACVPEGVKEFRGVFINPADGGAGGYSYWTEEFRNMGFASLGVQLKDINKGGQRERRVRDAVEKALPQIAEKSGHPELANVPWFLAGFSRGGGWSDWVATNTPDRALGYASVGCWVNKPAEGSKITVPGVYIMGAQVDGFNFQKSIPENYDPARKGGAPWTLALQPGRPGHSWGTADALWMPFFEAMIATRIPKDADPKSGPVKLKPVDVESGWLGDRSTWETAYATIAPYKEFKGDKDAAVWLPDRRTAYLWRAMVARNPLVTLEAARVDGADKWPAAKADKRQLLVEEGVEIKLQAEVKAGSEFKKMTFMDGDTVLGEATGSPWTLTWKATGFNVHGIYVEYETADGTRGVSNAGVVVVAKPGMSRNAKPGK